MSRLTLVFIHGVGTAQPREKWLDPLTHSLAALGLPVPQEELDRIIEPDYVAQMELRAESELPPITWKSPDEPTHESHRLNFATEAERLARAVLGHQGTPRAGFARAPEWIGDLAEEVATRTVLADVGNYKRDTRTKASALKAVLRSMPSSGRVIIVGYSLGSVIATDLLRRLSDSVTVELLLTVGSPLGLKDFGDKDALNDKFPYDRVRRWINVYDPSDPATGGRGAGKRFSDVVDVPVNCRSGHDVVAYMSQRAVAQAVALGLRAALGEAALDPSTAIARRTEVARQLAAWTPVLLQHAYLHAVSAEFADRDWRKKARFGQARQVLASRMAQQIADAVDSGRLEGVEALTEADLSRQAARLLRGTLSLEELLPYLVSFASDVPVAPFEFELSEAHTLRALEGAASAILKGRLSYSRADIAARVMRAARTGREAVSREKKNDNGWLLILGAAVLAATGVGLVAAIPAGLAGAAAVTATLAAFGPGGMVGGIATIAALTGSGSALIAGGAAASASDRSKAASDAAHMAQLAAETLWTQPLEVIRSSLATLLGVLEAQRLLDLEVALGPVIHLVSQSLDRTSAELALHTKLSPDSAASTDLKRKYGLFEKALAWVLDPTRKWPSAGRELEQ